MKKFIIFSFIIMLSHIDGSEVLEKVIDKLYYSNLIPKNIYWIDIVNGGCNIETSFNSNDSSFSVGYKFISESQSDFFEILMNYEKNIKSFNCNNPIGLSIKLRIDNSLTNKDVLKFMLIEDLNMDGSFNGDDGIFAFEYQLSNLNSNWLEVKMPYNQFFLWYSNSNNSDKKLNLEKIRAWRITIFNQNKNKQLKKVYFKELIVSCMVHQSVNNFQKPLIKSSFIQLWNNAGCACGDWSLGRWLIEIGKMIEIGIQRLVIQYSVYETHSWYRNNQNEMSTLDKIAVAAEFYGFKVVFGLYFDEKWNWESKYDEDLYNKLYSKHMTVIDDIFRRFGTKSIFEGIYLPQEWNNIEWKNDKSIELLGVWTRNVLNYIKKKKNVKFIISPFFRNIINRESTALLYDKFLSIVTNNNNGPFIDEIYIQDSYGVDEQNSFFDIYTYLEKIKTYTDKYNTSLGVTIEIFNQTTKNGVFAAIPATIDRIKSQINIASYLTNNLILFEWGYMMLNNYNLYYDYKKKIQL
jgi:hypothetical protein